MDCLERRLEALLREIGRLIVQATLRQIETADSEKIPARIDWRGETFRRNRMTQVITGTLTKLGGYVPTLRYVTDAGCHSQAYFCQVLQPKKHPTSGAVLGWSWGVDFYHACEYVSKLAAALFGSGNAASVWASKQRRTLRTKTSGVARVVQCAAQQKRRQGLKGTKKDFDSGINYLKTYRRYMDFASRRRAGEPIGSGITEAGCKVIFNQRLKQSGMRWHCATGQHIVDLRTATRSGLWHSIWQRMTRTSGDLPAITKKQSPRHSPTTLEKTCN